MVRFFHIHISKTFYNMKKHFFLLGIIIICLNTVMSQTQTKKIQDDESVVILKEIQQKLQTLTTAEIKFSLRTEKENKILHLTKGNIWIKGDKYKLIIPSQHVYCDSIDVWNYLPEQNEVTISPYDSQDDENAINPIKLVVNYQKYYRSAFIREQSEKGVTVQIIDLYPLQAAPFFRTRLTIDKKQKEILQISISERSGYTYTYSFNAFIKNPKINDVLFIFSPQQHPDIEVIDLR